MKTGELNAALAAANPVQSGSLDGLEFAAMEADLLADLATDRPSLDGFDPTGTRRPLRRYAVALGAAAVAAVISVIVLLAGSGADQPSRAYGAELVRFAESSPLLLLEGPGWRVEDLYEQEGGEGSMEFVTGRPIPDESTTISADGTVSGMARKADRQRKVDLSWRRGKLEFPGAELPGAPVIRSAKAPVLDTTALVNTRAERLYTRTTAGKTHVILLGGPGDRQMVAIWKEGGLLLEMHAWVPNLAAFEERLGWLHKVDSQTWLDAMPAKVVKAADHDATVREMLRGDPPARRLQAVADPRRRPHHQPLPGGRRGYQHRLLPLVPPVGRSPYDRRPREEARSRTGNGERQALADRASDREGRRLSRHALEAGGVDAEWDLAIRTAQVAVAAQGRRFGMCPPWTPAPAAKAEAPARTRSSAAALGRGEKDRFPNSHSSRGRISVFAISSGFCL